MRLLKKLLIIMTMTNNKIVLVGQAPSSKGLAPLETLTPGSSSGRLLQMMGITADEYRDSFIRLNLIDHYPGRLASGRGDKFPLKEAKKGAVRILSQFAFPHKILCVGHRVGECFIPKSRIKYYEWILCVSNYPPAVRDVAVIPHTSGLNRYWNDPDCVRLAENFLRKKVLV